MLHFYGKLVSFRDSVLPEAILHETGTGGDSGDQNVRYFDIQYLSSGLTFPFSLCYGLGKF